MSISNNINLAFILIAINSNIVYNTDQVFEYYIFADENIIDRIVTYSDVFHMQKLRGIRGVQEDTIYFYRIISIIDTNLLRGIKITRDYIPSIRGLVRVYLHKSKNPSNIPAFLFKQVTDEIKTENIHNVKFSTVNGYNCSIISSKKISTLIFIVTGLSSKNFKKRMK